MNKEDSYVIGNVYYFSNLDDLSKVLSKADISHTVGEWAIRLDEYPSTFKIAYVGNITPEEPYEIEVDGYSVSKDIVASWLQRISGILKESNIAFDMTHFDSDEKEIKEYVNKQ